MLSMMQASKLNGLQQQMLPFRNMFNMMRNAKNPSAMMQQMMKNNPAYSQAMDIIKQNGGDAKTAFYKMAEQNGVNAEQFLSMFR